MPIPGTMWGFDTIDVLADRYRIPVDAKKHKALYGRGVIEGGEGHSGETPDVHEFEW